jgi:hypothetical protein
MNKTEIWLTAKEAAGLLSITVRDIRRKCEKRKFEVRETSGNGGKRYEILLSSLPEPAQQKYFKQFVVDEAPEITAAEKIEIDTEAYAQLPDWQKEFVNKFLSVIKETEGLAGKQLKAYLKKYQANNPGVKGFSYGNFMKTKREYEEKGLAGLAAGYGKNAGKSSLDDNDFEVFKSLYLKEGQPTLQSCWYGTKGYSIKRNGGEIPENYPSAISFLRRLEKEMPEGAIYLARYGAAAFNKKYGAYADRDFSDIKAGEVWVSDHRQLDQAVMLHLPDDPKKDLVLFLKYFERDNRQTSRPVFPWITAWRCFKTGKWMGWNIHYEDPNSDHIFQAFYNAAVKYGLPTDIIIDNGKDYRCKDFAGGTKRIKVSVDEKKTRSMVSLLNIIPHFALPYNAQTKNIERDFRIWKEWKDKQMPGYRGGNHVERPEKLVDEIKRNKIVDYEQFVDLCNYFIENILHAYKSEGKSLLGRSRNEAFNEEFNGLTRVTVDALKLFCMRASGELAIRRNGVTLNQKFSLYYWAEWMSGMQGRKVYLRRDINKYQEAWVFDFETDEYLGKAEFQALKVPALAKDDLSKQQVHEVIKIKQRELKIMKSYLPYKQVHPQEILENMALGIAADAKYNQAEELPQTNVILKTDMDDALTKEEQMKKEGTGNYSSVVPERPFKKKIFLFESDKKRDSNG